MNDFLAPIIPLTFIATMVGIYYTRRNLKTTKYIDTITSERIKWLGVIREEVANIVANIYLTLKIYSDDIRDVSHERNDVATMLDAQEDAVAEHFFARTQTISALEQKEEVWGQGDCIKKLYLFKLRLNPNEDKKIIEIVDYFIEFYAKKEHKYSDEIVNAKENVEKLVTLVQGLLKQEWDKVKKETRGK